MVCIILRSSDSFVQEACEVVSNRPSCTTRRFHLKRLLFGSTSVSVIYYTVRSSTTCFLKVILVSSKVLKFSSSLKTFDWQFVPITTKSKLSTVRWSLLAAMGGVDRRGRLLSWGVSEDGRVLVCSAWFSFILSSFSRCVCTIFRNVIDTRR